MAYQAGRPRSAHGERREGAAAKRRERVPASVPAVAETAPSPSDPRDVLRPMLEALLQLAGAAAGKVRVWRVDDTGLEPLFAIGAPAGPGPHGEGTLVAWCTACAEAGRPDSECVRQQLCGREDRFPVDRLGPVCRHVVAVPLHHRGRRVGTLELLFAESSALPPAMPAMLQAVGDMIGMTLENARLTREAMRVSLMNERQMMANEVHDSLAQGLTYMRMRMSLLSDAIRQRDELRAFKYWSDVDDSLSHAHARLRELITCFRSRMDPQGLVHALTDTAEHFFDRTGVALDFTNRVSDFSLPPEREVEVYHIIQEALANISRHAHAHHARMSLDRTAAGYEIAIEDDGVGLAAAAGSGGEPGHYGIAIMRERATRLGGEVIMEPVAGAGTRVRVRFPEHDRPCEEMR